MRSRRDKAGRTNAVLATPGKTHVVVSRQEVLKAAESLRKRHQQGLELLHNHPIAKTYGSKAIKTVADEWGINEDTLRKMRVFADEKKGYSPAELEELCTECLKYGRPLGFSFVVKFLTIPDKRERAGFQREAIRNDWSLIRVKHELVTRYGRRRRGGKRPAIPKTVNELLADLETKCIGWQRLIDVLRSNCDADTSGLRWQDLPQEIQERLALAAKAIDRLQKAVAGRLTLPVSKRLSRS